MVSIVALTVGRTLQAKRRTITHLARSYKEARNMSKATLYDFNPRNTGLYEARLWKAYYDRDWPLALLLVYRMLRSQFNLSQPRAALATYCTIRAAVAWAPRDNNPEVARPTQALLRRAARHDQLRLQPRRGGRRRVGVLGRASPLRRREGPARVDRRSHAHRGHSLWPICCGSAAGRRGACAPG